MTTLCHGCLGYLYDDTKHSVDFGSLVIMHTTNSIVDIRTFVYSLYFEQVVNKFYQKFLSLFEFFFKFVNNILLAKRYELLSSYVTKIIADSSIT